MDEKDTPRILLPRDIVEATGMRMRAILVMASR